MPKHGHPGLLGEVPQRAHVRRARVAVVEHDRRVGEQHADEEVPHHPARRREPEDAVAVLRVEVQVVLLEVLERGSRPASARSPSAGRSCPRSRGPTAGGRTGTRSNVELLVGRRERLVPVAAVGVEVAERHRALERGHLALDALDQLAAVVVLAAVAVAVDRQQHLRLDLGEAVDDASARRSPASSSTRPRRGSRRRRRRRSSRGCSACRRRRGRRARCPSRCRPAATRAVCSRSSSHVHSPERRAARRRGGSPRGRRACRGRCARGRRARRR